MSKIIVVAYHPIVLKGICEVISEKIPNSNIIATATDIKSFLKLLATHKPETAVIDVAVTWKSEIDLVEEIHRSNPSIKLHFISVHPFDQNVQEYLLKKVEGKFEPALTGKYTSIQAPYFNKASDFS